MSTITSLEQQKNDKTRCSVYLDGVFYCGLKIEVAVKYRLKPGMTIEKSELDAIQFENEKVQATERAMNHLSATMKTCRQMRDFLNSKGYTQAVADYVIDKLEGYGYIDDYAYCRAYVNSVSGKGKTAIRAALIKRGALREAIDAALDEVEEDEDEVLAVAQKYMRGKSHTRENLNKALRHLISRGFDYDVAKSALSRLGREEDE
ncbi:MAG TPA: RecX family transcriptional regulator [Candidatus Coproplasma excrementipullorum]|nr:RecX family transcriptional regulator [Candidatus Coproplasma excrementipullorum]